MKKLLSILMLVAVMVTTVGCNTGAGSSNVNSDTDTASQSSSKTTSSDSSSVDSQSVKGFSVDGTKLIDAKGNEFVIRGINHPHAWFVNEDETAVKAIAKTGANTVRIVCSDGQQYEKDTTASLEKIIKLCNDNNMIAVLEVHDITGMDDKQALEKTADFWIEMKSVLIGKEDRVILNIANEWTGSWDSGIWEEGYTEVIPELREAGIKNTIMVDAAGWGQFGESIDVYGKKVLASDPDKNTMFSVHMYGSAGKNKKTIEKNLKGGTDNGLCIIVGEFGHTHSDGDVDEAYIMEYCTKNNLGYIGWSWKGNGGGVEYLDIAVEWDGSVLSSDWGEILINGENGIKATSKKCSIFE